MQLGENNMAYFLKQSKLKKGLYLQIYDGVYDENRKGPVQKSIQTLGYYDDLIKSGIKDPVKHFKHVVDEMNEQRKQELERAKQEEIGERAVMNIGHFLAAMFFNRVDLSKEFKFLTLQSGYQFDVYKLFKGLVYARIIEPCSKHKTLTDVFPSLYGDYIFSEHEMYEGLRFLGEEHEGIVELLNHVYSKKFPRKTDKVYFDATNFYFEIDGEDKLRRKGPSKENRHDPIVGMGLLLDSEQIPLAVSFYPGNQSEIGELPKAIETMKTRYGIVGKTIQVADKGLNCSKNIIAALKRGDGYLFSQSVKKLSSVEKEWVLNDNDWKQIFDSKGEMIYEYKTCVDDFPYSVEDSNGKKIVGKLTQKRMVTFNPSLAAKQTSEINKMANKVKELSARGALKSDYGDAKKYVTFVGVDDDGCVNEDIEVQTIINQAKLDEDRKLAGYNLLITSEINMKAKDMYETYHQLWRIEETFRILKSKLEARPVYVQNEYSIYGHFLINYVALFILRVLQIKVFDDKIHPHQIIDFCRDLNVIKYKKEYFNLANRSLVEPLSRQLKIDILPKILDESKLQELMKMKI